ncbi:MAG: hypothetical protein LM573_00645 [Thermofilum sp.]|jgi:hypothetical protein|nr:hypothetical protein [Thermofilum sp.]
MSKKKLVFTKHAKEAIVKRELNAESILNAILAPDELFWDRRSGCMVAIKKDALALIVVYDVTNEKFRAVTAFKSSRLVKPIRSDNKGCRGKIR